MAERQSTARTNLAIHFIGKRRAIEPVYKNNIQEVLEIETGHMVGLFAEVLPDYGLDIEHLAYTPVVTERLECAEEDYYLGTFAIVPRVTSRVDEACEIYVQAHPDRVADLPAGQYRYQNGELRRISDKLILKKHVIAINQQVYERSSFGITVVSKATEEWRRYIQLGKRLQQLQMNGLKLGFMSSGYSSKTGNDLPSAKRMDSILQECGEGTGPSYFFVGGRVSENQWRSEGMKEDTVHMRGPAEMIRDDLRNFLPDYMVPNRVIVRNQLPLTANGKIDFEELTVLAETEAGLVDRVFIAPRTKTEQRISDIWARAMRRDAVSVRDDFFESGGNSLIAVGLINRINKEFDSSLPLQVVFQSPTIEKLARKVEGADSEPSSRLVRLRADGAERPVYCWPGLGGYTMNLRLLASRLDVGRPLYGVQAYGINEGEVPYATIKDMAAADIEEIRRLQPMGPYTLCGYSFGARVAFETAYQLEQSGEQVDSLVLIAPGAPRTRADAGSTGRQSPTYHNKSYVTILFSVFAASITGPMLDACLRVAEDEESFAAFIHARFRTLDTDLVKRIIRVVRQTYEFTYTFRELAERHLNAPMRIIKARGDDYSFLDSGTGYASTTPTVVSLTASHYSMLKEPDIGELVQALRPALRPGTHDQKFRSVVGVKR